MMLNSECGAKPIGIDTKGKHFVMPMKSLHVVESTSCCAEADFMVKMPRAIDS